METISLLIDSSDGDKIISTIQEIEVMMKEKGFNVNFRFTAEALSVVLKNKDYATKLKDIIDLHKLGSMTYHRSDILNAITYGFTYHRDSMNNNEDVPLGNKLQWLQYYAWLTDEEKKAYITQLIKGK